MLRLVPTWKGNLLIFGLLIFVVLAYFFWQARQAQETFLNHARLNSRLLAAAIERNARSAVMSQDVVEKIMQTFLGNSARFVDYLDAVEPFSAAELAAFSAEAGLAGIRIVSRDGSLTEGPPRWVPEVLISCKTPVQSLQHLVDDHLYVLTWKRTGDTGCIVVGIPAARIEKLQEQIGLPRLLASLSGLAGVHYVRLEANQQGAAGSIQGPDVRLIDAERRQVAETRLAMDRRILVVGLDAAPFYQRIRLLWREFFIFSAILAGFGILFSWLLYRFQNAHVAQVRSLDGKLARQREDAALGRAAASITHEIRNPLNAINMGLQRLAMEAPDLTDGQQGLIRSMLAAVQRTDGIVGDLKRFASSPVPRFETVSLADSAKNILALYRHQCEQRGIALRIEKTSDRLAAADTQMIDEVVENLIKNAVEAQPEGGEIEIVVGRDASGVFLSVENPGRLPDPDHPEGILEPYFTTKTRGTGLGLAIAGRIIRAHGGRIAVVVPAPDRLRITVHLPEHVPAQKSAL
ncbi:MAG: HAMP domain-containing histidine kinase [Desulfobacterales bacterium]|nr:HAMP domain-containing histidine kinase [Desulfobacterales bacterium]